MAHRTAVLIPAGGAGSRFGGPKQFADLGGKTILERTLDVVGRVGAEQIVVAVPADSVARVESWALDITVVAGGATRAQSVKAALSQLDEGPQIVAVHDAARPLATVELFTRVFEGAARVGAAVAALPVADTLKRSSPDNLIETTIDREHLWAVQTPQAFRREILERAYAGELAGATDEAVLVERTGVPVELVLGEVTNRKITTPEDLALAHQLIGQPPRVGLGRDRHPLEPGRALILCGLEIEGAPAGPVGHSDGDVLCHAIADAILGAAGAGDLGTLFPDDAQWTAGISGDVILAGARDAAAERGLEVSNLDATIWLAKPRLAVVLPQVRKRVAEALHTETDRVNLKAKSGNDIEAIGAGQATEAEAIVVLRPCP